MLPSQIKEETGDGSTTNTLLPHGCSTLGHLEDVTGHKFSDIAGCLGAVKAFTHLRDDLVAVKNGDRIITLPLGVFIHGGGSAKTMLVKALAAESESHLLRIRAGDLIGLAEPLREVQEIFSNARDLAKSVSTSQDPVAPASLGTVLLLIEDLHYLLSSSDEDAATHGEERKILHAVFREMADLSRVDHRNLVVFATASNGHISRLKLKNETPFTSEVEVTLPETVQCRLEILGKIFNKHLAPREYTLPSSADLTILARMSHGMSGADLHLILQVAAENARRDGRVGINLTDMVEGFLVETIGERRNSAFSAEQQLVAEVHEHGGHGIIALAAGIPCILISTQPRGHAGGQVIPDNSSMSSHSPRKHQLLAQILLGVGGISAERFYFGDLGVSSGSGRDLRQVQRIAQNMLLSGMLGDHYDLQVTDSGESILREPHIQIINRVITNACITAEKILDVVSKSTLEKIMNAAREAGRNLIGPDAEQFYAQHLSEEKMKKIIKLTQTFFEDATAEMERPRAQSRDTVL